MQPLQYRSLTGTTLKFIDAPWVGTHTSTPEADISSAIVRVGKGPQENLDRVSEIWMGGCADDDGGTQLLAAPWQDEPQEEDAGDQAPAEDKEEPATVEGESEGEHEEDEEPSATEAGGSEGSNESGGADGDEELPVSQASQEDDDDDPATVEDDAASASEEEDWEEDNRRSERLFGYDPDRVVDVWDEYQAAMEDPMFAY